MDEDMYNSWFKLEVLGDLSLNPFSAPSIKGSLISTSPEQFSHVTWEVGNYVTQAATRSCGSLMFPAHSWTMRLWTQMTLTQDTNHIFHFKTLGTRFEFFWI